MNTPERTPLTLVLSSFCSILACVIVLLAPGSALAVTDDKSFPATSCRRMQADPLMGQLGVRLDGSVENDSPSDPLTVICPLVRDNTQALTAWAIDVRVDDQHDNAAVTCTATSLASWGAVVGMPSSASTTIPNKGGATLLLNPASQGLEGYMALKCTLPPSQGGVRSRLIAYSIREPDTGEPNADQKSYTGTYAEIATSAVAGGGSPPPFILYPDLGKATPKYAASNDEWILPVVRDEHTHRFNRARIRLVDSNMFANVECWMVPFNENGTDQPNSVYGAQDAAPNATVLLAKDNFTGNGTGPLVIWCDNLTTDVTLTMYDVREDGS